MTKRNPMATALAKPQYRQRIDQDARRRIEERLRAAEAWDDAACDTVWQAEGWQDHQGQMEG